MADISEDPRSEAVWRAVLTEGHTHRASFLPGTPKCRLCHVPMGGPSGVITRTMFGRKPSRKNPGLCNY